MNYNVVVMVEKIFTTFLGDIHYWINDFTENRQTLVFLPGLTADHRLFNRQIEYFKDRYNCLVWDAPGHCRSRPFELSFSLDDKVRWLKEILDKEGIVKPIFIGQSMGGYVSQVYLELYPGSLKGFVSIDSAPLQREYITGIEIWLLKRMEPIYRMYNWKTLLKQGSKGVAESVYGQNLMKEMMESYNPAYYAELVGHGYRILADVYESDRSFRIDCPALLICGEKDRAGSTKTYNLKWAEKTGIPLVMIKDAGHNSNTDKPEEINGIIEEFIKKTTN